MTDEILRPSADDDGLSPERRALLRGASALVAGAAVGYALAGTASAQQSPGAPAPPFPGFTRHRIETSGGVSINAAIGGNGPPLLLLHGAPMSHYTWRDVAPGLAEEFTVIAADLRGYGDSSQPPGLPDHSNYSKRAMALDQVEVMRHFGFERFAVVGQDRGGRVAHRMALDHPDVLTRAVFIDIVPTYYLYTNVTLGFVQAYFHWFSYLQRSPTPENMLLAQREAQISRGQLTTAQAEYLRTNGTPAGVHAMCEDYRAAASIDLIHDAADLDERVRCPLHVLWAEGGAMERLYDVLAIWRERGTNVTGKGMPGGHNMQEGAPAEVLAELQTFLRA
jgi:haloacetate dehalogenase